VPHNVDDGDDDDDDDDEDDDADDDDDEEDDDDNDDDDNDDDDDDDDAVPARLCSSGHAHTLVARVSHRYAYTRACAIAPIRSPSQIVSLHTVTL